MSLQDESLSKNNLALIHNMGEVDKSKKRGNSSHKEHHEKEEANDGKTNPLVNGHVKKIASLSQAGKGEDGFTKVNQDSFLVIQNEYKLNDFNIFAVLDGHGVNGHLVSRFVTKYFNAFL